MSRREVRGVAIDATYQSISEAPYWQGDGETVDATADADGEVSAENVPDLGAERPDVEGQSTWADWATNYTSHTGGDSA